MKRKPASPAKLRQMVNRLRNAASEFDAAAAELEATLTVDYSDSDAFVWALYAKDAVFTATCMARKTAERTDQLIHELRKAKTP